MQILRTPDERFAAIDDWPYEPRYLTAGELRVHYVDEGPRDAPVALLVHGEPTWSYMWRHVMRRLIARGVRCVAWDHVGFGRSDKVAEDDWYVIERHCEVARHVVEALDLRDVTLVAHDWGGPIGVRQAVDMPERFSRMVLLNTWVEHDGMPRSDGWLRWVELATSWEPGTGDIPAGDLLTLARARPLPDPAPLKAAYDAPFPDASFKAGARRFPRILPWVAPEAGNRDDQQRCWDVLHTGRWPTHLIFGEEDPIFTRDIALALAERLDGATLDLIPSASHFVAEEAGDDVADALLARLPR